MDSLSLSELKSIEPFPFPGKEIHPTSTEDVKSMKEFLDGVNLSTGEITVRQGLSLVLGPKIIGDFKDISAKQILNLITLLETVEIQTNKYDPFITINKINPKKFELNKTSIGIGDQRSKIEKAFSILYEEKDSSVLFYEKIQKATNEVKRAGDLKKNGVTEVIR